MCAAWPQFLIRSIRLSPSKKSADDNAHSSIFPELQAIQFSHRPSLPFPSEMASIKSPSNSTCLVCPSLALALPFSAAASASPLPQPFMPWGQRIRPGAGGSPRTRPNIRLGDYGAAKDDLPIARLWCLIWPSAVVRFSMCCVYPSSIGKLFLATLWLLLLM